MIFSTLRHERVVALWSMPCSGDIKLFKVLARPGAGDSVYEYYLAEGTPRCSPMINGYVAK